MGSHAQGGEVKENGERITQIVEVSGIDASPLAIRLSWGG